MERPRTSVIVRWIIAGLIGGGGVFLLAGMFHDEESVPLVNRSLLALSALATGILLVAPELVRLAVAPISHLIDSVLSPSERVVPPADLKLARFYSQSLRYDEACEEYERILQYHPDNADAHLEGIRAAALAGDERRAAKFYHHAQRSMRSPEARELLDAVYAARQQPLEDVEAVEEQLPGDAELSEGGTGDEPAALPENPNEPGPDSKQGNLQ